MSIIEIRKAQREGARLVIGIAGISGSGKTYSAIQLGYGLANCRADKLGFLDTENRRGSLYSDALPEPFLIGDLYAPFSPQRYIDAIKVFQDAGVEVLVIDSVTHEWEGSGGCEEIASNTTSKIADWKKAKAEHKRFMNMLLQSNMHVIVCIRAREKVDFTNPREPKSLGIQPIQEKNFMFEMTASLMMWDQGQAQSVLKCPAELSGILGRETGYITVEDGKALRAWVDGAKALDPKVEAYRNRLQTVTEGGLKVLEEAWSKTPAAIKTALGSGFYATLEASAKAHQEARKPSASDAPSSISALNERLTNREQERNKSDANEPAGRAEEPAGTDGHF